MFRGPGKILQCAKGDTAFPGYDSLDHRDETRSGMGIDDGEVLFAHSRCDNSDWKRYYVPFQG
jgi:hypothetical protein